MCGIIATNKGTLYGNIQALKALEYRGYDSTGFVALTKDGRVITHKSKGNISKLMMTLDSPDEQELQCFMGHTRWATHGAANDVNAHPHFDPSGRYAIVMNGIVENHLELIKEYHLDPVSETDTEVLISMIALHCAADTLEEAIRKSLTKIRGALSCVILDTKTGEFYAVQRGTELKWFLFDNPDEPLDRNENGGFYAYSHGLSFGANATEGLPQEHGCYYTVHGTIVKLGDTPKGIDGLGDIVCRSDNDQTQQAPSKGDYESFMLKEIHEQSEALENLFRGRIRNDMVYLGGINEAEVRGANFIHILGCGSSLHAGRLGQMYIEELAEIKTIAEQAAEFRYRSPMIGPKDMFVTISQSGETADIIEAINYIQDVGHSINILGICNNVGSTIAEKSYHGFYTRAGIEVGVASTKTFINQVASMLMLALYLAEDAYIDNIVKDMEKLPNKISKVLNTKRIINEIRNAAEVIAKSNSCIFMGRGYNLPIAQEGALKMKELSYIHAEAYSGAELKHGPLALIDANTPTVAFWNHDQHDKVRNNIFEIQSRGGDVIIITDQSHEQFKGLQIMLPHASKYTQPIINCVAAQMLAYETAKILGNNIDQPRNLAKSVTVE